MSGGVDVLKEGVLLDDPMPVNLVEVNELL